MTPTTWREAARGIPPWPGAVLVDGGRCVSISRNCVQAVDDQNGGLVDRSRYPCSLDLSGPPDLSDPDTLAAFDRRLALRLGCPAGFASIGVRFYREENVNLSVGAWCIDGGQPVEEEQRFDWIRRSLAEGVTDPLLARCLAWHSVKP